MTGRPQGARSIDETLAAARARLLRVTPAEAFSEFCAGAILIDIRPAAQRAVDGEIPGSVIVERNHLEWRFDPRATRACRGRTATTCGCSAARLPTARAQERTAVLAPGASQAWASS